MLMPNYIVKYKRIATAREKTWSIGLEIKFHRPSFDHLLHNGILRVDLYFIPFSIQLLMS